MTLENDDTCDNCGGDISDCTCGEEDNCPDCGNAWDNCSCDEDDTCPDCGEGLDDCTCDDPDLHQSNIYEGDGDHDDIEEETEEISKFINVELTNIKATLKVRSNEILFRVLSQNEKTRNFKKIAFYNDFVIQGIDYPRLEKNKIFLRGKMAFNDTHESSLRTGSQYEAESYVDEIHKALKAWDKELSQSDEVVSPKVEDKVPSETKPPEVTRTQTEILEQFRAFMTQQRETIITKTPTGGYIFS